MENREIKLSRSVSTANELRSYFNATIIGSVLLEKMIGYELISDVDVAIDKNIFWNVHKFLTDKDFKETKRSYSQKGYADFIGSLVFEKEGQLPIHLLLKDKDFKLKSIPEIIKEKFERYSDSDRNQLKKLLNNNVNNNLWKTEKP